MRELLILAIHLLVTFAKLLRPGGVRAVAAESLLLKHQLLVSRRSMTLDRFVLGLTTLFVSAPDCNAWRNRQAGNNVHVPQGLDGSEIPPALFLCVASPQTRSQRSFRRTDRGDPSAEVLQSQIRLCAHAPQLSHVFGIEIDKDVVRRVLAKYYRPSDTGATAPSWLTFIAETTDSLWSLDLFRCESILLRSHWVLVVIDVFSRRIIGFGVKRAYIDGVSVCRMFNQAVSSDTHQHRPRPAVSLASLAANRRILEIEEMKSVPYNPVSHPFVERLIGTIRREYLDRMFFWNAVDLTRKLGEFRAYYNAHRVHRALAGSTPARRAGAPSPAAAALDEYAWQQHYRGLFQNPIAA